MKQIKIYSKHRESDIPYEFRIPTRREFQRALEKANNELKPYREQLDKSRRITQKDLNTILD